MNLHILVEPNPILHTKCAKINKFDEKLKKFANDMVETLFANNGVGLAAPQLGKTIRLLVLEFNPQRFADLMDEEESANRGSKDGVKKSEMEKSEEVIPLTIIVNPKIISTNKNTDVMEEGCLSLPKKEFPVRRFTEIKVLAQDLDGNRLLIKAKGLFARILQHEIDHLKGILITDKIEKKIR